MEREEVIYSNIYDYNLPVFEIPTKIIDGKEYTEVVLDNLEISPNFFNITYNNNCIRWLRYDDSKVMRLCSLYITPGFYKNIEEVIAQFNKEMKVVRETLFGLSDSYIYEIIQKYTGNVVGNYDVNNSSFSILIPNQIEKIDIFTNFPLLNYVSELLKLSKINENDEVTYLYKDRDMFRFICLSQYSIPDDDWETFKEKYINPPTLGTNPENATAEVINPYNSLMDKLNNNSNKYLAYTYRKIIDVTNPYSTYEDLYTIGNNPYITSSIYLYEQIKQILSDKFTDVGEVNDLSNICYDGGIKKEIFMYIDGLTNGVAHTVFGISLFSFIFNLISSYEFEDTSFYNETLRTIDIGDAYSDLKNFRVIINDLFKDEDIDIPISIDEFTDHKVIQILMKYLHKLGIYELTPKILWNLTLRGIGPSSTATIHPLIFYERNRKMIKEISQICINRLINAFLISLIYNNVDENDYLKNIDIFLHYFNNTIDEMLMELVNEGIDVEKYLNIHINFEEDKYICSGSSVWNEITIPNPSTSSAYPFSSITYNIGNQNEELANQIARFNGYHGSSTFHESLYQITNDYDGDDEDIPNYNENFHNNRNIFKLIEKLINYEKLIGNAIYTYNNRIVIFKDSSQFTNNSIKNVNISNAYFNGDVEIETNESDDKLKINKATIEKSENSNYIESFTTNTNSLQGEIYMINEDGTFSKLLETLPSDVQLTHYEIEFGDFKIDEKVKQKFSQFITIRYGELNSGIVDDKSILNGLQGKSVIGKSENKTQNMKNIELLNDTYFENLYNKGEFRDVFEIVNNKINFNISKILPVSLSQDYIPIVKTYKYEVNKDSTDVLVINNSNRINYNSQNANIDDKYYKFKQNKLDLWKRLSVVTSEVDKQSNNYIIKTFNYSEEIYDGNVKLLYNTTINIQQKFNFPSGLTFNKYMYSQLDDFFMSNQINMFGNPTLTIPSQINVIETNSEDIERIINESSIINEIYSFDINFKRINHNSVMYTSKYKFSAETRLSIPRGKKIYVIIMNKFMPYFLSNGLHSLTLNYIK